MMPAGAVAGSICGTLTDAVSALPVAGAGVFVRLPDGSYAGEVAVSDATGAWCVHDLAAGTYTLEIRVDNYLTRYVNGVVVTDSATDVPLVLAPLDVTLDPPWPNPASDAVKLRLNVARTTSVELGIYDARGRLVQRWAAGTVAAGTRDYGWDGRDISGRPVPAGLYFIRLRSNESESRRSFVLNR